MDTKVFRKISYGVYIAALGETATTHTGGSA
jgi:hypothetical protein